MDLTVVGYVHACDSCQRNKASREKPQGLLQPLPVPDEPWSCVHFDMITKLPKTEPEFPGGHSFDTILVYVCRLTKMIIVRATVESIKARQFARMFSDDVVRLFGMPKEVVSDRGTQFNNEFMNHVFNMAGVKRNLTSAYHPQSNGQVERVNSTIEGALRSCVQKNQKDWDRHLGMIEFALNNHPNATSGESPFDACYRFRPKTPIMLEIPTRGKIPHARQFGQQLADNLTLAKESIAKSQDRMKQRANGKRKDVVFQKGDQVLLSMKNRQRKSGFREGGAKKLRPLYMGPFEVIRMMGGVSVMIDLPVAWIQARVHNVFHVSLIKMYTAPSKEHGEARVRKPGPPPTGFSEGEPEFTVERIVDHRDVTSTKTVRKKKVDTISREYLVKWLGYDDEEKWNTWEPRNPILLDCGLRIREYKSSRNLTILPEDWDEDEEEASVLACISSF